MFSMHFLIIRLRNYVVEIFGYQPDSVCGLELTDLMVQVERGVMASMPRSHFDEPSMLLQLAKEKMVPKFGENSVKLSAFQPFYAIYSVHTGK